MMLTGTSYVLVSFRTSISVLRIGFHIRMVPGAWLSFGGSQGVSATWHGCWCLHDSIRWQQLPQGHCPPSFHQSLQGYHSSHSAVLGECRYRRSSGRQQVWFNFPQMVFVLVHSDQFAVCRGRYITKAGQRELDTVAGQIVVKKSTEY